MRRKSFEGPPTFPVGMELSCSWTRHLCSDNINPKQAEKQAKDNDEEWAQQQYLTPDPSLLGAFMANSISIPVKRQGLGSF